MNDVPTIPLLGLAGDLPAREAVAAQIGAACRAHGFFYVTEHGVDLALCRRLEALSREFFAQPLAEKMHIAMAHGGRAWRGYFPSGAELTSGKPDLKEGRGGLRDVHALWWSEAAHRILIDRDDRELAAAYAVLLEARVELQRRTGRVAAKGAWKPAL